MLNRISISNFRSCDATTLELGSAVVTLVGKNGVGKTNLLHSIQLASRLCSGISRWSELSPQEPDRPASLTLEFGIHEDRFEYAVVVETLDSTKRVKETLRQTGSRARVLLSRDNEVVTSTWHPSAVNIGPDISVVAAILQLSSTDSEPASVLRPIVQLLAGVRYYRAVDNIKDHEWISPFVPEATYVAWSQNPRQHGIDSVALRLIHMHLVEQDKFAELTALLGPDGLGLLAGIYVGKVPLPQPLTAGLKSSLSGSEAYVLGFSPGDALGGAGRMFPYSGLSSGTRRVVQMLTYLIFDESSAMLLEQPEDSIHVGLLQKIVDVLRTYSHKSQLVMSTHSNRVLNLISPLDVRVVTAEAGKTHARRLSTTEAGTATAFIDDSGTLSEFLETL